MSRKSRQSPPSVPEPCDSLTNSVQDNFSTWIEESLGSDFSAGQTRLETPEDELLDLSLDDLADVRDCLKLMETVWPTDVKNDSRQIGPYTLLNQLGRGGMGEVWEAEQKQPIERKLALKLIRNETLPNGMEILSRDIRKRFIAERRLLAKLEHPNIARMIDAGESDQGQLYFAMELVEGQTIKTYCDVRKANLKDRVRIFADACSAVEYAHRKGIVHRDLKPANILVTLVDGKPVPKVIDFGLAKLLKESIEPVSSSIQFDSQKTQFGDILGTIEYMSPEQAAGDHDNVDTRSDVYSLGVVLYSLITQMTPVKLERKQGDSKADILQRITQSTPRPPSEVVSQSSFGTLDLSQSVSGKRQLVRELRTDLDWITMKALATSPDDRYPTVESFTDDLKKYLNHQPISARPRSIRYMAGKYLKRNKFVAVASALLLLCLIGGVIGTTTGWINSARARKLAETNLAQARTSNQILTDIFNDLDLGSIDHSEKPVKIVFAERLKKAGRQIIDGSQDEPVEVIHTLNKLSNAMNSLGFPQDAVPLCRYAAELSATELGEFAPTSRETQLILADLYIGTSELDKSQQTMDPLLDYCRNQLAPFDNDTVLAIEMQAKLKAAEGDSEAALEFYQEAKTIRENGKVGTEFDLTRATMGVAENLSSLGKYQEASKLFEEILDFRRKRLTDGHPDSIRTMVKLSYAIELSPDPLMRRRSGELTEEAFRLSKSTFGKHHRETYVVQTRHASNLVHLGRYQEGLDNLNVAFAGLKEICGETHRHTISARTALQLALGEVEDYKSAIPLAKINLEINQKELEPGHVRIVAMQIMLANLYIEVKEFEKALQAVEAVKIRADAPSSGLRIALQKGEILLAAKEYERANRIISDVVAEMETTSAVISAGLRTHAQIKLAQSLSGIGDHQAALELLDDTESDLRANNPRSGFLPSFLAHRGIALHLSGEHLKGIDLMEQFGQTGQLLRNRDYQFAQLYDAYAAVGDTEKIVDSLNQGLTVVHRMYPEGSLMLARKLKKLGQSGIQHEQWEFANSSLKDALIIFQAKDFDGWDTKLLRFQTEVTSLGLPIEAPHPDSKSNDQPLVTDATIDRLIQLHSELRKRASDEFQIEQDLLRKTTERLVGIFETLDISTEHDWQSTMEEQKLTND